MDKCSVSVGESEFNNTCVSRCPFVESKFRQISGEGDAMRAQCVSKCDSGFFYNESYRNQYTCTVCTEGVNYTTEIGNDSKPKRCGPCLQHMFSNPEDMTCVEKCPDNKMVLLSNRTCVDSCPEGTYRYDWSQSNASSSRILCYDTCPIFTWTQDDECVL